MSKGGSDKKPTSKKVQALLASLERRRGIRKTARRFLIVCEDDRSAPNYFEAFRSAWKLSATSIEIVGSGGRTQPSQVVRRAVQMKDLASDESAGTEPFDEVWSLVDGDYGHKVSAARKDAHANGVQLAVSTPCFEYWVLLHFEKNSTPAEDCNAVIHALREGRFASNYEKGSFTFKDIVDRAPLAAERARNLREARIETDLLAEHHNPCSEVYLLVENILRSVESE